MNDAERYLETVREKVNGVCDRLSIPPIKKISFNEKLEELGALGRIDCDKGEIEVCPYQGAMHFKIIIIHEVTHWLFFHKRREVFEKLHSRKIVQPALNQAGGDGLSAHV